MDQRAEGVVRDFLTSWENMTPDVYADWFSEDGIFDDVPRGIHRGRAELRKAAEHFPPTRCEILKIMSDNGSVITERIDHFQFAGVTFALRIVGIVEINAEGKITLLRDYYDMMGMMAALRAAGINVDTSTH